ncbi:APC family permease [Aneurinibacillus sp. Ricciae_BoGa-3]|uniref:APC family permease n=1 Tax=Aneurinibacillus sp. Ricciae_BoGa-3 TaxID=3022697 RepID=UPI00233FA395|nr:APC family permease [Aneurinibacillus sp. Ricciae_BoGa-3]WCK54565.1 APC family permease [Aneurinibacillus sp. Ricciae_BoGa-3]
MKIKHFLFGRPLSTEALQDERMPKWMALPILSSDALSSVAYGTESILIALVSYGVAARWFSLPIALVIVLLLFTLIISYRQVINGYPKGGGAYAVAKENFNPLLALVACAALLVDYTLTVAVSSTAGVAAITSAFPQLVPWNVVLSVLGVLLVAFINMRGLREAGTIFAFPTYFFILNIFVLLIAGLFQVLMHGVPSASIPMPAHIPQGVTLYVLLRAFSSGCSALTGVEAVSNATPAFRDPTVKNAKGTLLYLGILLFIMFLGITLLANMYAIAPSPTGNPTVLAQVAAHLFGHSWLFYSVQFSTALVLFLATNTAFSGFPLLASIVAQDGYMPRQFSARGDRLSLNFGIIVLSLMSILLIVGFNAKTDALVPLYAIGVFLSFTIAQTGMVKKWMKEMPAGWRAKVFINGLGAIMSFSVVIISLVEKFSAGAWTIAIIIPVLVWVMFKIKHHYASVARQLKMDIDEPLTLKRTLMIVPVGGINRVVRNSLEYALESSPAEQIVAFHVALNKEEEEKFKEKWKAWDIDIRLETFYSRYRSIKGPLLRFIDQVQRRAGDKFEITVVLPIFITRKRWQRALHNQSAYFIERALLRRKDIILVKVPFHLHS